MTLTNLGKACEFEALDVPFAPERGSHKVRLTSTIFIDASDFRREDSPDYFGLAPGKVHIYKYIVFVVELYSANVLYILLRIMLVFFRAMVNVHTHVELCLFSCMFLSM